MRAIVMHEFGPPSVLQPADVPDPVAGPGEVLIDVKYANVVFVETAIRAGRPPNPAFTPELPTIPGNGVGGVVVDLGASAGASLAGARVVTPTGGSGAYAERVAVSAAGVVRVPDGLALDEAVALLADGRTAMALMREAAVAEGETVLVEAAAGGVGSLLVQLARDAGARVVAAAGGPHKTRVASDLGADVAVDYTRDGWPRRAGPVDVVFDGVGGAIGRAAFELLRPGGRHCMFGMAGGAFTEIGDDEAAQRGVTVLRGMRLAPEELAQLTAAALDAAAAGRLRPIIGRRVPLERAADAHRAIEARETVGKTLLVAGSDAGAI